MKSLRPLYKVLYFIIITLAKVLVPLLFPLRVIGKENLIQEGGFVLAVNHIVGVDGLFVIMARGFGKKMLVMGKEELFEISRVLNFFWNIGGVFPVDRGTGDRAAINLAIDEVKKGRGLLIFPEGHRSADGKLKSLKSGAFVVAMQAGTSMIPCVIKYAKGKPKAFTRTTVIFGKPFTMEELGLVGEYSPAKLRAAKKIFTTRLEELDIAV